MASGKNKKDNQAAHAWRGVCLAALRPKTPLHVIGTNFQMNVWWALLAVPVVALSVTAPSPKHWKTKSGTSDRTGGGGQSGGHPNPCHRLLSQCGDLTGYAWGIPRKRALLAKESLQSAPLKLEQTSLELSAQ